MSIIIPGSFPARRLRRSRTHSFSRRLVAENQLTVNDLESLICFKRAGADGILTYFASSVAQWLNQHQREY
ncbi:TPA: hypothetical protein MIQ96_25255 [Klebsiella pneumoniae]|nr:hypothetical protein [Klebsiella pneumoniae]